MPCDADSGKCVATTPYTTYMPLHALTGERNYHVLYQLCAATHTPAERAALQLLPAADFRYLGESARVQVPGVDD